MGLSFGMRVVWDVCILPISSFGCNLLLVMFGRVK